MDSTYSNRDPKVDGGISLLKASHKNGLYSSAEDAWFASIADVSPLLSACKCLTPGFQPGDVLCFSSLLVHRTVKPALPSNSVRFSLQFRFSDYSCPILEKNKWYFNYHHCRPLSSLPPLFTP